jgi:hypothetical protein
MVEIIDAIGAEAFKQQFADSPQLLVLLEASFSGAENAVARAQLLELTDESPFTLRQWVESMRTLNAWLGAHGLQMSVEDQLGYICCAGESASAAANLTVLPALVEDMLETYGCERARRVKSSGV